MRHLILIFLLLLTACVPGQPALTATDVDIASPVPGMRMGAAYLTLHNNTATEIRIDKVASPQLNSVEMHESVLDDGVSRMRRLTEVVVAPGDSVVFERGAKHLMLGYPAEVPPHVTLQFFADDAMLLSVNVPLKE